MWSYSAPDRTPKRPTAPAHESVDQVATRHVTPGRRGPRLRLIPSENTSNAREESIS
jgi:hypothetical protein